MKKRAQWRTDLVGYAFVLPNLIGFLVFIAGPFLFSLALGFFQWDAVGPMQWVGLQNYIKLAGDSTFKASFLNTFYFTFTAVPLTLGTGLGLALLLNRPLALKTAFRTVFFLPNIVTVASIVIVWQAIYHPTMGPLNMLLASWGVTDLPTWTMDLNWAMPSIVLMSVWLNAGYYMVIFLAALSNVPQTYYEAARIDGAGGLKRFLHVTLPGISPTIFFVLIMAVINSFKVFDQVMLLTKGGPGRATNVLVYYVYTQSFTKYKFGAASAAANVLFLIILIVTIVQYRNQEKWVTY